MFIERFSGKTKSGFSRLTARLIFFCLLQFHKSYDKVSQRWYTSKWFQLLLPHHLYMHQAPWDQCIEQKNILSITSLRPFSKTMMGENLIITDLSARTTIKLGLIIWGKEACMNRFMKLFWTCWRKCMVVETSKV